MGNRLSKIYTRTGDKGTTGLASGERVSKDSLRIEAIGCADELNSLVGMLASQVDDDKMRELLTSIQHDLFDLGGELAMPEYQLVKAEYTSQLENQLDHYNSSLPPLKEFILPAGSMAVATCHLARSVCRRTERRCISLHREQPLSPHLLSYINRLSDLLFVLARTLARANGGNEIYWNRDQLRKHKES